MQKARNEISQTVFCSDYSGRRRTSKDCVVEIGASTHFSLVTASMPANLMELCQFQAHVSLSPVRRHETSLCCSHPRHRSQFIIRSKTNYLQLIKWLFNSLLLRNVIDGSALRGISVAAAIQARISRSFSSSSLPPALLPNWLYDLLDVTIHLQQDGNWKCSITGFPSSLMANRFL